MNDKTENVIYSIWNEIAKRTSCNDANRIIEPLKYYIETGRCSGIFIKTFNNLTKRQITTIAKRLITINGMDYEKSINLVISYIR